MSVLALQLLTDGCIALIVGGVPTYLALGVARQKKHHSTGPGFLAWLLVPVWLGVIYACFVEPRMLQTQRHDIALADAAHATEELRIAVISDTHLGQYRHRAWLETVVEHVNALQPDAVFIAGDIASTLAGTEEFQPFKKLETKYGVYAVLGNWDYRAGAVDVRHALGSQNVKLLVNRSVPIEVGGRTVSIIGLDDQTYGVPDFDLALQDVPEDAIKLLLTHNPDAVTTAETRDIDLVIAGHTHCGQIRLPGIGAVPKLPITIGQKYDCGYFPMGQTRLFITPGVGESTARARFLNPPEISLLRLVF